MRRIMPRPRRQSLQTEIRPRFWSDGIDMRSRHSKKLSRPTRNRDVRDLDYNRDNLKVWTCTNKLTLTETIQKERGWLSLITSQQHHVLQVFTKLCIMTDHGSRQTIDLHWRWLDTFGSYLLWCRRWESAEWSSFHLACQHLTPFYTATQTNNNNNDLGGRSAGVPVTKEPMGLFLTDGNRPHVRAD